MPSSVSWGQLRVNSTRSVPATVTIRNPGVSLQCARRSCTNCGNPFQFHVRPGRPDVTENPIRPPLPKRSTPNLRSRIPWTTSKIVGTPEPPAPYRTQQVFSKLKFNEPLAMASAPGSNRLLVVERRGKLYTFENSPTVEKADLLVDVEPAARRWQSDGNLRSGVSSAVPDERLRLCYVCPRRQGAATEGKPIVPLQGRQGTSLALRPQLRKNHPGMALGRSQCRVPGIREGWLSVSVMRRRQRDRRRATDRTGPQRPARQHPAHRRRSPRCEKGIRHSQEQSVRRDAWCPS